ncbi:hypothetical protein F4803DRAFT_535866 [Xylaria telfairii]|nr:hypothetical protein F4803DRAFT_535866 [Xylaria telfairii]
MAVIFSFVGPAVVYTAACENDKNPVNKFLWLAPIQHDPRPCNTRHEKGETFASAPQVDNNIQPDYRAETAVIEHRWLRLL